MAKLHVQVEPIALLRDAANASQADPVRIALQAELGGADGIVCPLREESVGLTDRDLKMLRDLVQSELTILVAPKENQIARAMSLGPARVVVVPGKKPGSTSGGGLDVLGHTEQYAKVVEGFQSQKIMIYLLVEPLFQQIKAVAKLGADGVHLHLGKYAQLKDPNDRYDFIQAVSDAAIAARKMGLNVSAGFGLTYDSASDFSSIGQIDAFHAGRSIITRALFIGMEAAVRDMVALVR